MPVFKVLLEVFGILFGIFVCLAIVSVAAAGAFPELFPEKDADLSATKGYITLECSGNFHSFTIKNLGISYKGKDEKNVFLVLIWGNKVTTHDGFITLYPDSENGNVYSWGEESPTLNIKFDEDAEGGDEPMPVPGSNKSQLILAFFQENEYCRDLALRMFNEPGKIINGLEKYSTDYTDFLSQCSSKMKNLGVVKTNAPILIKCEETINIETLGTGG